MRTFASRRLLGPFLLIVAACGDDTTGAGGGGGEGTGGGATQGTTTGPTGPTTATGSTTASSGTGGDTASSGGTGGGGEGGNTPVACEGAPSEARIAASSAYAEAACTYYGDCHAGVFAFLGNEQAICVALVTLDIDRFVNVDDAALVDCLEDLADLYGGLTCSDPTLPEAPASCSGVGNLPDGWPCENSLECASGVCASGPECGTCVATGLEEGDPCEEDEQCLPHSCNGFECAPPQEDGADCDSGADCEGGACLLGSGCGTITYVGEGDPCDDDTYCEGGAEELACDADSGECVANPRPTPGTEGGACVPWGIDFGGGFVLTVMTCEEGAICVEDVCAPHALPNEACTQDEHCVESTCDAGICEPNLDPNACACSGLE